jgi:hypothetical protein
MTSTRDDTAAGLAPSPDLAAMRAKLFSDFANGVVGQHHNSFQHRSRILRQLSNLRLVSQG